MIDSYYKLLIMTSKLDPEYKGWCPNYVASLLPEYNDNESPVWCQALKIMYGCEFPTKKTLVEHIQKTLSYARASEEDKKTILEKEWTYVRIKKHLDGLSEINQSMQAKDNETLATEFRLRTFMFSSNGQISSIELTTGCYEMYLKSPGEKERQLIIFQRERRHEQLNLPGEDIKVKDMKRTKYHETFWKYITAFFFGDRSQRYTIEKNPQGYIPTFTHLNNFYKFKPLSVSETKRFVNDMSPNARYYLSKISETRLTTNYGIVKEHSECIFWNGIIREVNGTKYNYFKRKFKEEGKEKAKEVLVKPEEFLFDKFCSPILPKHSLVKTCDHPSCINPLHHVMENTRKRRRENNSLLTDMQEFIENHEECEWMIEYLEDELSIEKKHSLETLGSISPELYSFMTRKFRDKKMTYK